VKQKGRAYGIKKVEDKKKNVGWVEGSGLEICQQGKSHAHVPVPQRYFSGLKALGETKSHGVEINPHIPEKGNFAAPHHLVGKPRHHSPKKQQGYKIRSENGAFSVHG
jgi:hypothetical protein